MITTIKQMTFIKTLFGEGFNLLESHVKGRFLFVRTRMQARFGAYLGFSPESSPMIKLAEKKDSSPAKPKTARALNYDIERMQTAVEAAQQKRIEIPRDLSFEEMRDFIINNR